jgi:hypothetical protein
MNDVGRSSSIQEEFIMEILSLNICAEKLGTTVRTLRHYLTKEQIVPYRQLELGGTTHVRYFTAEDFTAIQEWWVRSHAQHHASKGEFHTGQ